MSWWHRIAEKRLPDEVIGGSNPYLLRWHLRRTQSRSFNAYLHQFLRSDDDRHLHNHPWSSCSIILEGAYMELGPMMTRDRLDREYPMLQMRDVADIIATEPRTASLRQAGDVVFRGASSPHCIIIPPQDGEVWSLFITGKNRELGWGFFTEDGYINEKRYRSYREIVALREQCEATGRQAGAYACDKAVRVLQRAHDQEGDRGIAELQKTKDLLR